MASDTIRIRPTCSTALELAHEILVGALQDAERMNWRSTEDRADAARYVLDGARMLPGRDDVDPAAFPLLVWSADADGWKVDATAAAALRGHAELAGVVLVHIDRLA